MRLGSRQMSMRPQLQQACRQVQKGRRRSTRRGDGVGRCAASGGKLGRGERGGWVLRLGWLLWAALRWTLGEPPSPGLGKRAWRALMRHFGSRDTLGSGTGHCEMACGNGVSYTGSV